MYFLSPFCCICINEVNNLIALNNANCKTDEILEKLETCRFEIDWLDEDVLLYVCKQCQLLLDLVFDFLEMCQKNNKRLRGYVKHLELDPNENYNTLVVSVDKEECDNINNVLRRKEKIQAQYRSLDLPEPRTINGRGLIDSSQPKTLHGRLDLSQPKTLHGRVDSTQPKTSEVRHGRLDLSQTVDSRRKERLEPNRRLADLTQPEPSDLRPGDIVESQYERVDLTQSKTADLGYQDSIGPRIDFKKIVDLTVRQSLDNRFKPNQSHPRVIKPNTPILIPIRKTNLHVRVAQTNAEEALKIIEQAFDETIKINEPAEIKEASKQVDSQVRVAKTKAAYAQTDFEFDETNEFQPARTSELLNNKSRPVETHARAAKTKAVYAMTSNELDEAMDESVEANEFQRTTISGFKPVRKTPKTSARVAMKITELEETLDETDEPKVTFLKQLLNNQLETNEIHARVPKTKSAYTEFEHAPETNELKQLLNYRLKKIKTHARAAKTKAALALRTTESEQTLNPSDEIDEYDPAQTTELRQLLNYRFNKTGTHTRVAKTKAALALKTTESKYPLERTSKSNTTETPGPKQLPNKMKKKKKHVRLAKTKATKELKQAMTNDDIASDKTLIESLDKFENFESAIKLTLLESINLVPKSSPKPTKNKLIKPPSESTSRNIKIYNCTMCKKWFYRKLHLESHLIAHKSKKKTRKCLICNVQVLRNNFKRHTDTHSKGPVTCTSCQISYVTTASLKRHINTFHKAKPFVCKTCGQRFKLKTLCDAHMKKRACSKNSNKNKPFSALIKQCPVCETRFFIMSQLIRHIQKKHPKYKLQSCANCSEQFYRNNDFVKHVCQAKNLTEHNHEGLDVDLNIQDVQTGPTFEVIDVTTINSEVVDIQMAFDVLDDDVKAEIDDVQISTIQQSDVVNETDLSTLKSEYQFYEDVDLDSKETINLIDI